jgi:hypothetical protein
MSSVVVAMTFFLSRVERSGTTTEKTAKIKSKAADKFVLVCLRNGTNVSPKQTVPFQRSLTHKSLEACQNGEGVGTSVRRRRKRNQSTHIPMQSGGESRCQVSKLRPHWHLPRNTTERSGRHVIFSGDSDATVVNDVKECVSLDKTESSAAPRSNRRPPLRSAVTLLQVRRRHHNSHLVRSEGGAIASHCWLFPFTLGC